MAEIRTVNKEMMIVSENVDIVFKASGGVVFRDSNGEESKFYELGQKRRKGTDEAKRDPSEAAAYTGFEIQGIEFAVPTTVNFVQATPMGGERQSNFVLMSTPLSKTNIMKFLLQSIFIKFLINDQVAWSALADTEANTFEVLGVDKATDIFRLELVADRTGSDFIYDQYFVESADDFEMFADDAMGGKMTPIVKETVIQNYEFKDDVGAVSDLVIPLKVNFYGDLDRQIMNTK